MVKNKIAKIGEAARLCNIGYENAKSIWKIYKNSGRVKSLLSKREREQREAEAEILQQ